MSTSKELQFQKVLQIHLKPVRKNVLRIQTAMLLRLIKNKEKTPADFWACSEETATIVSYAALSPP